MGSYQTRVRVRTLPDGTIAQAVLVVPSGVAEWDQAVMVALEKAQKIPLDDGGKVPPTIEMQFRPR